MYAPQVGGQVVYRFNRWGVPGTDFIAPGLSGDPTLIYNWSWVFRTTTTSPVITGVIPPHRILRPSVDQIDGRLYIIWEPETEPEVDSKVGWIVAAQYALEGEDAGMYILPMESIPDDWEANGEDVNWKSTSYPEYDIYRAFPRMQWGIVYETIPAGRPTLYRSQVRMLRTDGMNIVPSSKYSFRSLSEIYENKHVFAALYLWRIRSFSGTSILGDGIYDGDGDGLVDTDTYDGNCLFMGVTAEFI